MSIAHTTAPRIGSLCTGYGGLDMAVELVLGGQLTWYAETDRHAHTVLATTWPRSAEARFLLVNGVQHLWHPARSCTLAAGPERPGTACGSQATAHVRALADVLPLGCRIPVAGRLTARLTGAV
ncbi:hypothetical protein MCAG_00941 [Micromonospora sp. ATCC 39149]|nr:hypothetical protein MCAG_00941 [Micromonospora sp. ATCC 39149]